MKKIVYADRASDNDRALAEHERNYLDPDYGVSDDPHDVDDEVDYVEVYIDHDTFYIDKDGIPHFGSENHGWPKWMSKREQHLTEDHDIEVDPDDLLDYITDLIVGVIDEKYDGDYDRTYDIDNLDVEVEYNITNLYAWNDDDPESNTDDVVYDDAETELVKNESADKIAIVDSIKPSKE